jgi:hypothetical protein
MWTFQGEDLVRESGIPYTIVRPCALTEEPAGADLIFDQGDNITVCTGSIVIMESQRGLLILPWLIYQNSCYVTGEDIKGRNCMHMFGGSVKPECSGEDFWGENPVTCLLEN